MSSYESIYSLNMKKGDRVGIAAPSGAFDPDTFREGLAILESIGLEPVVPQGLHVTHGYFAGGDHHRAKLFQALFEEMDIKAVMCARGGYGAMRMLGLLDGDLFRKNPKPFVGFSDITVLLNHMGEQWGIPCFHGPVVCSLAGLERESLDRLERFFLNGDHESLAADQARVLVPGKAQGRLLGGNLATLCHMTGTPFQPDFTDGILVLEDVGEAPYRIDRMLTQMKYAGMFDGLRAVVAGSFESCGEPESLASVIHDIFEEYRIPLVMDFPFGHGSVNRVFPLGVPAALDTDQLRVDFL